MSTQLIHIIIDEKTPRLEYVLDFMFNQVLQTPFQLHLSQSDDIPSENVIYYGKNNSSHKIWIKAHSLLFARGADFVKFKTVNYQLFKYPFEVENGGVLPFDPFAIAFYFLSQYEEQTDIITLDNHQRFCVADSQIAPYIHFPMVDTVCKILKISLMDLGIVFGKQENRFSFLPTFDIDIAFAHQAKSLTRHILGTAKLGVNFKFNEVAERLRVWMGLSSDPYNIFDDLLEVFEQLQVKALFFALLAENGKYNNNNSKSSPLFQNLLNNLNHKHQVYLHSSYHTMDESALLVEEKNVLEGILNVEIKSNRQHFLRFSLPEYWNVLIENNISDDYSQGFHDNWGYRCGTSYSHQAYDVKNERVLPLMVHPFTFMDSALIKLCKDDVVLVHEKMIDIILDAKKDGIPCIGVWHNYAMPKGSLYLENFIDVLKYACL